MISQLFETPTEKFSSVGASQLMAENTRFDTASDDEIITPEATTGVPLTSDLEEWLRCVNRGLLFLGNYEAIALRQAVDDAQHRASAVNKGDFDLHFRKILSWEDGRFDGVFKKSYWNRAWVPFLKDGCGNLVCVDLTAGPDGKIGQLLLMEFQDGQGPYIAPYANMVAMLKTHISIIEKGLFTFNEHQEFAF